MLPRELENSKEDSILKRRCDTGARAEDDPGTASAARAPSSQWREQESGCRLRFDMTAW